MVEGKCSGVAASSMVMLDELIERAIRDVREGGAGGGVGAALQWCELMGGVEKQ